MRCFAEWTIEIFEGIRPECRIRGCSVTIGVVFVPDTMHFNRENPNWRTE